MASVYEIRAQYDKDTLVVYQAYNAAIALPAVQQQRFQAPFSFNRMTWIKPSFLWLMQRSNWGQKANQEHILAIRITRAGWEQALSEAVLTSPDGNQHNWEEEFKQAKVIVQWDPEYSVRGNALDQRAIQVGISRFLIDTYVNEWIVSIQDITPQVRKMNQLRQAGKYDQIKTMLPVEKIYPVATEIMKRLGMK